MINNEETRILVEKKIKEKMSLKVEEEMVRLENNFKEFAESQPEMSKEVIFRIFTLSHIATLYALGYKETIADDICNEIFEGEKND
jgi:Holliday junction resolvasome RuvABC DNA-binding subunit